MPVLWRKLLRDLWQRKGALAALLVIVAIGTGSFIGMDAVWRDMDGARARYYAAERLADFALDLKRAPAWTTATVAAHPNVRAARGRVVLPVRIDLPHMPEPLNGTALSMPVPRAPVLNDVRLQTGAWFSGPEAREAILIHAFAEANGLRPGDRIRVLLLDQQHDLLIIGTCMSPEYVYLLPPDGGFVPDPARFGVLYLPERFLQQSADLEGAWNQIVGMAHDARIAALRPMLDTLAVRLDPWGVTNTATPDDMPSVKLLAEELKGLRISARVTPAIFLVVAALIFNIMLSRLIDQQRSVIGTLRALGHTRAGIARHYLCYGVAVGLIGGLAGAAFGAWTQGAFLGIYRDYFQMPGMTTRFYPDIFLGGVAISIACALAGTLRGLRTAVRLTPASAMRPPAPERGARIALERMGALWRPLPFRWKMILRAVFRNPYRSAVSIAASLVATSLIFATLSMLDALDYVMSYEFERVMRQDVTLTLRDPVVREAAAEALNLPGVAAAEPQLGIVCDVQNGPWRRRIAITALPRGGSLYTPLDAAGHPITPPARGIVLSRKLAEILHAREGDVLRVRPLIGERREAAAPITALTDTFFGLGAYADLEYLSGLLGERAVANLLLLRTPGNGAGEAFLDAVRERPAVLGLSERRRAFTLLEQSFGETQGAMIAIMVIFAGLIAFGSVLNTALVSLSERQREVGTLRVLGYEPGQVARIFSGESFLLNGVGVLAGLAGGVGLSHLLARAYNTELYRFPAIILPARFWQTTLIMIVFIAMAQLIIARLVHKLPWLDALKVSE